MTILTGQCPPRREARCAVGVASDLSRDCLYACGGYAGTDSFDGYLDSAEALDLRAAGADARWAPLPPMSCRRAGPNACEAPDGRTFVIGGGPDGQTQWSTMEALDPRTASWDTSLAQLHVGRHYNAETFGLDGLL